MQTKWIYFQDESWEVFRNDSKPVSDGSDTYKWKELSSRNLSFKNYNIHELNLREFEQILKKYENLKTSED